MSRRSRVRVRVRVSGRVRAMAESGIWHSNISYGPSASFGADSAGDVYTTWAHLLDR